MDEDKKWESDPTGRYTRRVFIPVVSMEVIDDDRPMFPGKGRFRWLVLEGARLADSGSSESQDQAKAAAEDAAAKLVRKRLFPPFIASALGSKSPLVPLVMLTATAPELLSLLTWAPSSRDESDHG